MIDADVIRPAAMRAGFAALDRLSPPLTARWALRLWCTLPDTAGRHPDDRPRPGVRADVSLPGGRTVAVETWGDGPPVYLVHGWGGWRGQLGAFVEPLVAAGRRVVGFDALSHGQSSPGALGPRRSTAVEMLGAFVAVTAAHGAPDAVVAHSLGCFVAALAVRDGLPVGRLAFVAPSTDMAARRRELAEALGYGGRAQREFDRRFEALARRPLRDFALADTPMTRPVLVVHDRADKEVPHREGASLAERWPSAALVSTDGLGHQRILRDPGVVTRVSQFVTAA
ncbi:alpha/beta fold hydrolase [Georgenia sp. AZ-5]|uniref:alpha/beta fold hydrolase n=1 Tax=Georgenia sp. AZ-5 TaxID=3367526 RepID=UPI0037540083